MSGEVGAVTVVPVQAPLNLSTTVKSLQIEILKFLKGPSEIDTVRLTCRSMREVCDGEELWKILFSRIFPTLSPSQGIPFKEQYRQTLPFLNMTRGIYFEQEPLPIDFPPTKFCMADRYLFIAGDDKDCRPFIRKDAQFTALPPINSQAEHRLLGMQSIMKSHQDLLFTTVHGKIVVHKIDENDVFQEAQVLDHAQEVTCFAFDEKFLFVGTADKDIFVWEKKGRIFKKRDHLSGHTGKIQCLEFHEGHLFSVDTNKCLKVWAKGEDGLEVIQTIELESEILVHNSLMFAEGLMFTVFSPTNLSIWKKHEGKFTQIQSITTNSTVVSLISKKDLLFVATSEHLKVYQCILGSFCSIYKMEISTHINERWNILHFCHLEKNKLYVGGEWGTVKILDFQTSHEKVLRQIADAFEKSNSPENRLKLYKTRLERMPEEILNALLNEAQKMNKAPLMTLEDLFKYIKNPKNGPNFAKMIRNILPTLPTLPLTALPGPQKGSPSQENSSRSLSTSGKKPAKSFGSEGKKDDD